MTREEYIEQIEFYNAAPLQNKEKIPTDKLASIYQSILYPQRRIDGQKFSDMQGAKLVILDVPDAVKKAISDFFAPSQNFLVLGWWKSALRDLQSREPNAYVSAELLGGIIHYVETYIEKSYK
ncbi:hypothetical protein N9609_00700 [bacterium]|nr:hypothetical protein [bacterium]